MTFDKTKFQCIVYIYLRSGHKLAIYCEDFKMNNQNNEITSYRFEKAATGHATYIRLSDISAVQYEQNPDWAGE